MGACVSKFSSEKDKKWSSRTIEYDETASRQPSISICEESRLVYNFFNDHFQGRAADLEAMKNIYSEVDVTNGTSNVWDLDRMTTDIEGDWQTFDGLGKVHFNRDDISIVILKALIAQGTDPTTLTSHGRTAFQIAALAGDLEFCKELVKMGVDVHQLNEVGETALTLVKQWNNKSEDLSQIISYLEEFH